MTYLQCHSHIWSAPLNVCTVKWTVDLVHMHVHTYICTLIHAYIQTHTLMFIWLHTYPNVYIHIYMHAHMSTYICMHALMHIYICIFHKVNSLVCHEANSDEYGGPFYCFTILSFNGSGPHCPYMVGV